MKCTLFLFDDLTESHRLAICQLLLLLKVKVNENILLQAMGSQETVEIDFEVDNTDVISILKDMRQCDYLDYLVKH
jgi:hypothetical protein